MVLGYIYKQSTKGLKCMQKGEKVINCLKRTEKSVNSSWIHHIKNGQHKFLNSLQIIPYKLLESNCYNINCRPELC